MSFTPFGTRRLSPAALQALDAGLRIRVDTEPAQRCIFSGAEKLPVQALASELAVMVSELRVRSFVLRGQVEEMTSALTLNVECGVWPLARRAALDLASLLASAGRRRLANSELCVRGSHGALRIAELCQKEAR